MRRRVFRLCAAGEVPLPGIFYSSSAQVQSDQLSNG